MDNSSSIVKIIDKKRCEVTGVKKLEAFDEKQFYFETILGYAEIKGKKMALVNLDSTNGVLLIDGIIDSFSYVQKKGESLWDKLFK